MPKEDVNYSCIARITIDYVVKIEKKISTGLFRGMQIQNKEKKNVKVHKHLIRVRFRVKLECDTKLE